MKKRVFVLLLAVAAVLSSCFSIPRDYKLDIDESAPAGQKATVTFVSDERNGWFYVNEWGDFDISDDLYRGRSTTPGDTAMFTVPAGANKFRFLVNFTFSTQNSSRTYQFDNVELQHNFEAQGMYEIKGRYERLGFLGFRGTDFYIGIYDVSGRRPQLLDERMIGTTRREE